MHFPLVSSSSSSWFTAEQEHNNEKILHNCSYMTITFCMLMCEQFKFNLNLKELRKLSGMRNTHA